MLAARRAGIRTIILPERNRKDLVDVPGDVRQEMSFEFAKTVGEVLKAALDGISSSSRRKRTRS